MIFAILIEITFTKRQCLIFLNLNLLFHDGGLYHIEINPLICSGNQWTINRNEPFNAWCPLKDLRYLNKRAAFRCKFVKERMTFLWTQGFKGLITLSLGIGLYYKREYTLKCESCRQTSVTYPKTSEPSS